MRQAYGGEAVVGTREAFPAELMVSAQPRAGADAPFGIPGASAAHDAAPPALPPCVFVVPAYNEEENILRLLDDLAARPELFRATGGRVVIVDDGSGDSTPELVAAYSGPMEVELVSLDRNQGPGALRRSPDPGARVRLQGRAPREARRDGRARRRDHGRPRLESPQRQKQDAGGPNHVRLLADDVSPARPAGARVSRGSAAVVGGGILGLTAAYRLSQAGGGGPGVGGAPPLCGPP